MKQITTLFKTKVCQVEAFEGCQVEALETLDNAGNITLRVPQGDDIIKSIDCFR